MISVGTYLRNELIKRKMSQRTLARKMKEKGFKGVHSQHIGNIINGTENRPQYLLLRKIEITLDLPEFILIKMEGKPSETKMKQIKEIKANDKSKK